MVTARLFSCLGYIIGENAIRGFAVKFLISSANFGAFQASAFARPPLGSSIKDVRKIFKNYQIKENLLKKISIVDDNLQITTNYSVNNNLNTRFTKNDNY